MAASAIQRKWPEKRPGALRQRNEIKDWTRKGSSNIIKLESVLSVGYFCMPLCGIVVSALAWHLLGREIESCPGI